jgi:hypothetical protein
MTLRQFSTVASKNSFESSWDRSRTTGRIEGTGNIDTAARAHSIRQSHAFDDILQVLGTFLCVRGRACSSRRRLRRSLRFRPRRPPVWPAPDPHHRPWTADNRQQSIRVCGAHAPVRGTPRRIGRIEGAAFAKGIAPSASSADLLLRTTLSATSVSSSVPQSSRAQLYSSLAEVGCCPFID